MSKLFVVSCCCIPETDLILLEFLLSVLEKQTSSIWQLSNDMSGDIAIIDVDDEDGMKLYKKMKAESSAQVLVTFATDKNSNDSAYKLEKPMRSADYISVMKSILANHPDLGREKNSEDTVQPATSTAASVQPAAVHKVTIKRPSVRRLYNLLTEDEQKYKTPVEITFRGIGFYVDFSARLFYCEHKLMLLSMLCKASLDDLVITSITEYDLKKIESDVSPRPLSELIWCCALLGSSGELSDKVNDDAQLKLKRWPNLKALVHLPRHITLTAFMTKHTADISNIAAQTRIQPDNVVDFVNACAVMGYLNVSTSSQPVSQEVIQADGNKVSLFGKIRSKFGVKG